MLGIVRNGSISKEEDYKIQQKAALGVIGGRGNELQSALENSLSKIGDVAVNFGEYID